MQSVYVCVYVYVCHEEVEEWETKIKQEQVNTRKREGEGESKTEREYEHKCEKCMASRYLWSSKGGNRCIGLSYFMSLPDLLRLWDMKLRKERGGAGEQGGAGEGRTNERNAPNYHILFLGMYLDLNTMKQGDHDSNEL